MTGYINSNINSTYMNRQFFCEIKHMNRLFFSRARYMIGVGFKNWLAHPYQNYPPVTDMAEKLFSGRT